MFLQTCKLAVLKFLYCIRLHLTWYYLSGVEGSSTDQKITVVKSSASRHRPPAKISRKTVVKYSAEVYIVSLHFASCDALHCNVNVNVYLYSALSHYNASNAQLSLLYLCPARLLPMGRYCIRARRMCLSICGFICQSGPIYFN